MSQQALKKIAFPPKEPTRTDLHRILELASRMMDRDSRSSENKGSRLPSNVIAFPGTR
jgi:hypothetical protein